MVWMTLMYLWGRHDGPPVHLETYLGERYMPLHSLVSFERGANGKQTGGGKAK